MPKTREFLKLKERIKREYLGKPVKYEYRKEFGKKYNKKDILPLTIKIAKSRGIHIDKKIFRGGGVNDE